MVLPSDSNPVMFNLDVQGKTELLLFFPKNGPVTTVALKKHRWCKIIHKKKLPKTNLSKK
jgi:hypothetical protein